MSAHLTRPAHWTRPADRTRPAHRTGPAHLPSLGGRTSHRLDRGLPLIVGDLGWCRLGRHGRPRLPGHCGLEPRRATNTSRPLRRAAPFFRWAA